MDGSRRRVINATAPVRICDLGGWTDTWFAGHGTVFNLGVYPYAEVQLYVSRTADTSAPRVVIHAENFGDRYEVRSVPPEYDKHPLLEACLDIMDLPRDLSFEVNLYSNAPAGCSTGTSAAVSVALLGALDLLTPGRMTPHEVAAMAHRVETEKLGLQCGIQDQLCSAYGGACFIEMHAYPHASVSQVQVSNSVWWELERRLALVFLGRSHASSEVHGRVIAGFEREDADTSALAPLRQAAHDAKNALFAGDFAAFGKAMLLNTEAQRALHPALVSAEAEAVFALAREHGAIGWKVNGAGGEGGSVTLLFGPESEKKRAFRRALPMLNPDFAHIPIYLSRFGLRQWESA